MTSNNKKGRKKKEIGSDLIFAVRLRELLEEKEITQSILATAIGVSRQSVGQWKNGKTVPDILDLQKLAKFFNVSADYLIGIDKPTEKGYSAMSENEQKFKRILIPLLTEILGDDCPKEISIDSGNHLCINNTSIGDYRKMYQFSAEKGGGGALRFMYGDNVIR